MRRHQKRKRKEPSFFGLIFFFGSALAKVPSAVNSFTVPNVGSPYATGRLRCENDERLTFVTYLLEHLLSRGMKSHIFHDDEHLNEKE